MVIRKHKSNRELAHLWWARARSNGLKLRYEGVFLKYELRNRLPRHAVTGLASLFRRRSFLFKIAKAAIEHLTSFFKAIAPFASRARPPSLSHQTADRKIFKWLVERRRSNKLDRLNSRAVVMVTYLSLNRNDTIIFKVLKLIWTFIILLDFGMNERIYWRLVQKSLIEVCEIFGVSDLWFERWFHL